MKRMLIALAVVLAVIFAAGLGEGLAAKKVKPPKPPMPVKDKYFKLVSSRQLPNKMWEYELRPKLLLKKDSKPFFFYSPWSPVVSEDENPHLAVQEIKRIGKKNYGNIIIISYNGRFIIDYGEWYDEFLPPNQWRWSKTPLSKLYDKEIKAPVIELCDGEIYEKGIAPFAKPPWEVGDDYVGVRRSADGEGLDFLVNNSKNTSGLYADPYGAVKNDDEWQPQLQEIIDSNGWGFVKVETGMPVTLDGYFGGDINNPNSGIDPRGSRFGYKDELGNWRFRLCVSESEAQYSVQSFDNLATGAGELKMMAETTTSGTGLLVEACGRIINLEPIRIRSWRKLPNKTIEYVLQFDPYAVYGSRLKPHVRIDAVNKSEFFPLTERDEDGNYITTVRLFNRRVRVTYVGDNSDPDPTKWSYADNSYTKFPDPNGGFIFDLIEGGMHVVGEVPLMSCPGTPLDQFVSYTYLEGLLTLFYDNNRINDSVAEPFSQVKQDLNWAPRDQFILDSYGCGSTTFPVGLPPFTVDLTFGGDYPVSWVDPRESAFVKYNPDGSSFLRYCFE